MAFPTKTTATATATSSPVSVDIQSPSNGDLVLVFVAGNRLDIPSLPTDWTSADTRARTIGQFCSYRAFYKVCDGSEGATVSVTLADTPSQLQAISYKFAAGTYTGVPEVTSVEGNNTVVDPPLLTPTWGSADCLWIAGMWNVSSIALSAEPSDTDAAYAGTLVSSATRMYTEHAEKTAASENPPQYTLQFAQGFIAFTAAMRGVSGGGSGTPALGRYKVVVPV